MTQPSNTRASTGKATRHEILRLSIPLFARSGFDGISMRDIAAAVGVTAAALYHHFADKESLYISLIDFSFSEKTRRIREILAGAGSPQERLEQFVTAFTRVLSEERDFQRLLHWTLLESTDARMQALADDVFLGLVCDVQQLVIELEVPFDPLLLTVSIMGMIMFPFEAAKASSHMPGYIASNHRNPEVLARHILSLLRSGTAGPVNGDGPE